MTSISYGATHAGRVRDHNEDTFADISVATPRGDYHLLVVADGMGGRSRGEVASAMAQAAVREYIEYGAWRDPARALRAAFDLANERVHAADREMGTTLVAVLLEERTGRYWTENVGDSRAYLVAAGGMTPLTNDHSAIAARVDAGQLTREEASRAAGRNVLLRAIGPDPKVESDSFGPRVLAPGERLLLCSDGLHTMVSEERIAQMAMAGELAELPKTLIEAANEGGGEDNITALVAAMPVAEATVVDASLRPPVRAGGRRLPQLVAGLVAFAGVVTVSGAVVATATSAGGGDGPSVGSSARETANVTATTGIVAPFTSTATQANGVQPTATPPITTIAAASPTATKVGAANLSGPARAPTAVPTGDVVAPTATTASRVEGAPTATPTGTAPSPTPTTSAPSPSPSATPRVTWGDTPTIEVAADGRVTITVSWYAPGEPGTDIQVLTPNRFGGYAILCTARASEKACAFEPSKHSLAPGTYVVFLHAVGATVADSTSRSITVP